jgi:ubiquinone/menaquinone biosynthesis C-methylase UbiE
MKKLHLGCGAKYLNGYINADINSNLRADIHFDMDKDKWPFEDNMFDEILAWHSIEHSLNYLHVIEELWRVAKPGGLIHIGVPYITSAEYNLVNPYHHVYFNEHSFLFFEEGKLLGSANELTTARFRTDSVKYCYFPEWENKTDTVKEFARRHLFNVVQSIEFFLTVVK